MKQVVFDLTMLRNALWPGSVLFTGRTSPAAHFRQHKGRTNRHEPGKGEKEQHERYPVRHGGKGGASGSAGRLYGISTVKRALDELVEAGYIIKQARFDERKNGGQTSNLYTLCSEAPQPSTPEQPTESEPPMPDEEVEKAVHSSAPDSTPGEQSALFLFPAYSFVNGFERKTGRQKCRPDAAWTGGQSIFVPP